ncbi:MAG: tetratricopeptide repeat protein [Bradymonadia bacterium]
MIFKISTQAKLLLAIGFVIAASLGIKEWSDQQKIEAMRQREQSPEARVRRAVERAERAAVNKQLRQAEREYAKARDAIDDAIAERPDNLKLRRSKLVILRQLAYLTKQRGDEKVAYGWAQKAMELAKAIHQDKPTETTARRDRIATAVAFVASSALAEPDARDALKEAIEAVGQTTGSVEPSPAVREMLARGWMRVADAEANAENFGASFEATSRALDWARSGTTADEQNRRLDSLPYKIATAAAKRAKTLDDMKNYERFEREALKALSISARLNEREPTIHGLLAAKRARLADSLEKLKRFKEAEELHVMATDALHESLKSHPQIQRFRLSLVRALNHRAAFYSGRKRNKDALETYKDASEVAEKLDESGSRARLISMGNYAQLLGRTDNITQARKVAQAAYAFAEERAKRDADERSVVVDKISAGLRLARLLRATPKPKRKAALKLARAERTELVSKPLTTKKEKALKNGLDALVKELR